MFSLAWRIRREERKGLEGQREGGGEKRKQRTMWRGEFKEKRLLGGVMFWVVTRHAREGMVSIFYSVKSKPNCFRVSLVQGWAGLRWL